MADIDIPSAASLRDDLRATIATLTAECDAARNEVLRLDQALTAARVAIDAAGIPDVEPYPDEPVDDRERSLRAGGRVIAMQDRIRRLTAERDAAVRERDEARGNLGGYVIVGGPQHVALWDAISSFTVASGGRSDAVNGDRMDAVVRVERAVSSMVARGGDDARRSGLTLTAEERAALAYAGKRCRVGFDRDYPEVVAYVATIDRLLAGARTVTVEQVREWAECNVNASGWDELEHALVAFLADLGIKVRP